MSSGFNAVLFGLQVMTVASAILVAFHPNILYASVALLMTFIGVAGLFVFAGADFLAGTQIIVYVGGVTILILFAIMLTQWMNQLKLKELKSRLFFPAIIGFLIILPIVAGTLCKLGKWISATAPENMDAFANAAKTQLVGEALLGNYVFAFEAVTVLLLGALVGAVWLARPTK